MCGVGAGVGVQCVMCGVCGVCGVAWHAENLRVKVPNGSMCKFKSASVCTGKTRACVQHARVLPVHTEAF